MQGQSEEEISSYENENVQLDGMSESLVASSSGRTLVWPYVAEEIANAPFWGHGREAMVRLGISKKVFDLYNQNRSMFFRHPHNAYLQLFLDNGLIGAMFFLIFHFIMVNRALILMRSKDKNTALIGGIGMSFFISYLGACITSLTFYPNEGMVVMWCIMGLIIRRQAELEHQNAMVRKHPKPASNGEAILV